MCAFQKILQSMLIALAALLTACGGGAGGGSGGGATAGIGGTGQIASGTITGFGSIFVNGIEFMDIETATCVISDSDLTGTGNCQMNLELGMVVEVTGTVNGTVGSATQVIFDNEVEGPVSGISTANPGDVTRTFTVLNIDVQIDSASTKFNGTDFTALADDDIVEVSGFFDSNGLLQATYVEWKAVLNPGITEVEIKGVVSAAPVSGAGAGDTFNINGANNITVTIPVHDHVLADLPGGVVSNGSLVEVHGTFTGATTIDANRVEPKDNAIGEDGDEISIEGLITNFVDQSDFQVGGQQVDATGATFSPATLEFQLANSIRVEIEGSIAGSTITAEEVEARGGDIKIDAVVTTTDTTSNTVTVQFASGPPLVILVDNQTQMEDNEDATPELNLSNIQSGDFLEIRGFLNTDPMIDVTASEIRRNTLDDDILQGPVENVVTNSSVTILGVTFLSDGDTEFEVNDAGSNSAAFYTAVESGCIVKVQDSDDSPATSPDGTADEISLESCPAP